MIVATHQALAGALSRSGIAPTLPYIPDEAANLPCIVVTAPGGGVDVEPAVFELSTEVVVLGRPVHDADAQAELMKAADQVIDYLGGTRSTQFDGVHFTVDSFERGTVTVAGQSTPAYRITVTSPAVTGC